MMPFNAMRLRNPVPLPTDPDYASVSLLLHGDGANGSTTFIDNGPAARTITASGSAQISTAQSKFGGASMAFYTGSVAGHVTTLSHAMFDFGSGDFTIEFWMYLTATNAAIICQKANGTGTYPFQVWINASAKLAFRGYNSGGGALLFDFAGATTLTTGAWHFCQARRSGTTFTVTLNGAVDGTQVVAGALLSNADLVTVGDYATGAAGPVRGFLDDVRITKGVVRAVTVPTAAFPNS